MLHVGADSQALVLSAQAVKPRDFASQINLGMENCWGIVRALIDVAMAMDDGKYLLVKCALPPASYDLETLYLNFQNYTPFLALGAGEARGPGHTEHF